MDIIHAWFLGYAQRFVDFAAKRGFNLFLVVEVLFSVHFVIFVLQRGFVFVWLSMLFFFIFGWFGSKPFIKPGMVNPRKYNPSLSLFGILWLVTGAIFFITSLDLSAITLGIFIFASQCDYVEPQVLEKHQKEVFAA